MIITSGDKFWNELKISENYNQYKDFDVLEIGALEGGATTVFANHFKRVFVIDPWDGRQQGNDSVYSKWKNATKNCTNVFHCKTGSETPTAKMFLKSIRNFNLGFVFIDGLHTREGVINDFELVLPYCNKNTTILLDDMDYMPVFETAIEVAEMYKDRLYELENYSYIDKETNIVGPICKRTFGIK